MSEILISFAGVYANYLSYSLWLWGRKGKVVVVFSYTAISSIFGDYMLYVQ